MTTHDSDNASGDLIARLSRLGPHDSGIREVAVEAAARIRELERENGALKTVSELPQPFAFYDEGELRFWRAADGCRDYLSSYPEIIELYTREQMDAALAAQPSTPAEDGKV
jgi:hypothetical protein